MDEATSIKCTAGYIVSGRELRAPVTLNKQQLLLARAQEGDGKKIGHARSCICKQVQEAFRQWRLAPFIRIEWNRLTIRQHLVLPPDCEYNDSQ